MSLLRTEFSFPHLRSRDHCAIGTTSSPHPPPCPRASARSVLTERRLLRKKEERGGDVPRRGRRGSFVRRAVRVCPVETSRAGGGAGPSRAGPRVCPVGTSRAEGGAGLGVCFHPVILSASSCVPIRLTATRPVNPLMAQIPPAADTEDTETPSGRYGRRTGNGNVPK